MVAIVAHQTNIANLGANLDIGRTTIDLQVFHHSHCVAVGQHVACRITNHGWLIDISFFGVATERPFMRALWAHQERTHFITVNTGTLRAWREVAHASTVTLHY